MKYDKSLKPQLLHFQDYVNDSLTGIFVTTTASMKFSKNLDHSKHISWPSSTIVFLKNGLIHNDKGPALYTRSNDGIISSVAYFRNGSMGGTDKPTVINYSKEFTLIKECLNLPEESKEDCVEYYLNGKLHRVDGPAIINHKFNFQSFFINGTQLPKDEFDSSKEVVNYYKNLLKEKMNSAFGSLR